MFRLYRYNNAPEQALSDLIIGQELFPLGIRELIIPLWWSISQQRTANSCPISNEQFESPLIFRALFVTETFSYNFL